MRMFGLLAGAVCMAAMAGVANADPIVNLTLQVNTATQTWQAFATITSNTGNTTSGLAGIQYSVIGAGGATVTSSNNDLPVGVSSGFSPIGFNAQLYSPGTNGLNITGYQSNNYSGPTSQPNVLFGVGLTSGSSPALSPSTITWNNPVLIGDGSYTGSAGTLAISSSSVLTTLLPSSLTPASSAQSYATFSPAAVNGQTVSVAAVPEPASLGVLTLGGLALLARRRKAS